MKRVIVFLVAILSFAVADAQLLKNSYFMEGSIVRSNLNPAFRPSRGYVNVPVAGMINIDLHSGLAVDDILFREDGKIVTFLDPSVTQEEFFNKIGINEGRSYDFDTDIATNVLGAGFYIGRSFFSIGVDANFALGASIPGDIFRFLKSGSGSAGSTFDLSSTALSFESTAKGSVGYSLRLPGFLSGLTVGARANVKLGFMRANISFDKFTTSMEQDHWAVGVDGTLDVLLPFKGRPEFVDADGKIDTENMPNVLQDAMQNLRPIGTGYSFDLGAEYDLGFLKASISVLDLGKMTWNNNYAWRGRAKSELRYDGFIVENGEVVNEATPELSDILSFESEDISGGESITTPMQATVAAGVEFDLLREAIGLGLVYMYKDREFTNSSQLSANLTLRPLSWLSASLSYTFENYRNIGANSLNSFGAAINLHTSWINLFVGTDYIMNKFGSYSGVPLPVSQKYFNFYFGLAVPLGKGKYE